VSQPLLVLLLDLGGLVVKTVAFDNVAKSDGKSRIGFLVPMVAKYWKDLQAREKKCFLETINFKVTSQF
jgi:hypothetical protein